MAKKAAKKAAKRAAKSKPKRLLRGDPARGAANRSAGEHILRNSGSNNGGKPRPPKGQISQSVEQAISDVIQLSSSVIEEQIAAGREAAERLRDGLANSPRLNSDITGLVENLIATTRDVGATWLELISIILRSIGTQPGGGGGVPHTPHGSGKVTRKGTSGGATTVSSITPADPNAVGVPPQIVVTGGQVKTVTLDLQPATARFVPFVGPLTAGKYVLTGAKFLVKPNQPGLVLTVSAPKGQAAGIYSGVVVDSSTGEPGGTLSVTVAG
jgi:hypothetical protein